ncbi:hypothetical protein FACS189447_06680 [Spirochaetia bacterium]|nr:hypothetical protein FACS189447_06680 [Spirochaetia bacterium]
MAIPKEKPYYTYADFLEWDESERCELVNGDLYMMSTPTTEHQRILMELAYQLKDYLKGKPCQVFPAPFAVRLSPHADKSDDTVFEPDIVVICDSSKIDKRGCNGAPDLIIEVISPSTASHDRVRKYNYYQKAGVREYWMVEPEAKTVQACLLEGDHYVLTAYNDEDTAPVTVLPGCKINLKEVFTEPVTAAGQQD